MSETPALRSSDAQRDRVAEQLREHFAAGRLNDDELAARLESVYGARTVDELAPLIADLPSLPASALERRAEVAGRRRALRRRVVQESGGGLSAFALCLVIWLASGASGYFWPVWVLIGVVAPLVKGGWSLYGPGADLDQLEQEMGRRDRRRSHRRQQELERRGLSRGDLSE